jgi:hypothetical protein
VEARVGIEPPHRTYLLDLVELTNIRIDRNRAYLLVSVQFRTKIWASRLDTIRWVLDSGEVTSMQNPLSTAREISKLVQDYNDIPLKKKIVQLEDEIIKLQEENRSLKLQLGDQVEMVPTGKHNYFYQGEAGPYCPTCWQRDEKKVLLPAVESYMTGLGRHCRICKQTFSEGEVIPRQRQVRSSY